MKSQKSIASEENSSTELIFNSFIRIDSNVIRDKSSELDEKDLIGCEVDCHCVETQNQFFGDLRPQNPNIGSDLSSECVCNKCGIDSNYDKSGSLINWRKPIHECGDNCFCAKNLSQKSFCTNRWTQRPTECRLQIFVHNLKGYSVRTQNSLKSGQFVIEYCGEVIDKTEAKKRFKSYSDSKEENNYILIFREHFGIESTFETIIDAKKFGNDSRFINHSCDPNLIALPVRSDSLRPRICLFAAKDIETGSELTYNYGSDESSLSDKKCFCFSPECKGFMPLDTNL